MNLRDLHYLVALAEHRHFGRAAEACFVSQPTLSVQVRKLEDELGVAIFERAPGQLLLTDVGAAIVARAQAVLAQVEDIRYLARTSLDPESGSLRLGIFPTLAPYLLAHVLGPIHERFPRLELLLTEEKTLELVDRLHQGRLDAAILAQPVADATLHSEFLFEEPFVLATPASDALARRKHVTLAELEHHSLLLLEDGHCLRDQALEVCRMSGARERRGFRATSLETLRQMVAADVGVTLLPVLTVQPPIPRVPNISLVPFKGQVPSRHIAMFWRKTSVMGEFLLQLVPLLRALPAQLLDPASLFSSPD
ncbi:MAG: LysR substrate-binding domain-containing protein [Ottowia sp.]|nr:LysR substrate-binding domain-containing protein [Ottowia sp.]